MIMAIRNDVALYAAHTNLDNAQGGVNYKLAEMLELQNVKILHPKIIYSSSLLPLSRYCMRVYAMHSSMPVLDIGNYDSCSYNLTGEGTFRPGVGSNPFVGRLRSYTLSRKCGLKQCCR